MPGRKHGLDDVFRDHWKGDKRSWQEWKEDIWWSMTCHLRAHPGLAPLEQYMRRSQAQRRCVECGEPGWSQQHSQIVLNVSYYWLCAGCFSYWQCRGQEERGPRTLADEYAGYPREIMLLTSGTYGED